MKDLSITRFNIMRRTYSPYISSPDQFLTRRKFLNNSSLIENRNTNLSELIKNIKEDHDRMKIHERQWALNQSFLIKQNVIKVKKLPSIVQKYYGPPELEINLTSLSNYKDSPGNCVVIKDLMLLNNNSASPYLERMCVNRTSNRRRMNASLEFNKKKNLYINTGNDKSHSRVKRRCNNNVLFAAKCNIRIIISIQANRYLLWLMQNIK